MLPSVVAALGCGHPGLHENAGRCKKRHGAASNTANLDSNEHQLRFEEWLAAHGAILHHVAHGFADGADRQDLMQELLLALWKAIPAFRHGSHPSTFIYRVSHNAALTWKRTLRNYRQRLERFQAEPAPASSGAASDDERHRLDCLYAAIRSLPPLDRSLVLLSLDGVSYAEMAHIHGLSESNVGVRLNRARRQLSESMKGVRHES